MSIRYTAVDNEHIDESGDSHAPTLTPNNDGQPEGVSANIDTDRTLSSFTLNKKLADSPVQGASFTSSGQNYKGPDIAGWPAAPQKLRGFSVPFFIVDVALVLLPVAFLALGISAWQLEGQELSETGSTVQGAMNLGPTIFPLAFAAIGSRCLRNVAVRLAERGTTIATLEKLLGSQSLVSAIGTAFTLRSISLLSLSIVLLWSLSPLGGQSSLRLLHEVNSTISEPGIVYYSDPDAPFDPEEMTSAAKISPAILAASLATSQETKALPVDVWNHPKIPRLDAIEQLSLENSTTEGDWITVNTTAARYSSWAGVNVQNLQPAGNAEFQARYKYIYLDCSVLFGGTGYKVWKEMLAAELMMYPPVSPDDPANTTSRTRNVNVDAFNALAKAIYTPGQPVLSMFLKAAYPSNNIDRFADNRNASRFERPNQAINLLYGAKYVNSTSANLVDAVVLVHTCAPHFVTVDAQITCQAGNCVTSRLRYVPNSSVIETSCSSKYTLGCMLTATRAVGPLIAWLPRVLMSTTTESQNAFDGWIGGDDITYAGYTDSFKNAPRIAEHISAEKISERLTIVLNTFYQSVAWGPQITRAGLFDKPDGDRAELANDTSYLYQAAPERRLNTSEAIFSQSVAIYEVNVAWTVTLLLITTILLLLSIVNMAVSFMTIAPDLFYYASSLARENPYTDTPDGGTAMDGGQRSRLLRGMKVQIADVSPHDEIGYVVLKSIGEGENCETGRLKKHRLYW